MNDNTALFPSGPEPAPTSNDADGAVLVVEQSSHNELHPSTSTPPSAMILTSSPSPSPQPPTAEQVADPRIALLKGMFPDFDDAVILSVLESTNNDQDRAIDILLGMSDPSYIPPAAPPSHPDTSQSQQFSQEDLDEQLARRLALEEEQAAARHRGPQDDPQRHGGRGQGRPDVGYQSYQPRRQVGGWGTGTWAGWNEQPQPQAQAPQAQGGQRDTMAELQQGFSKIAESGKRTFSSVVSRVRAKVQEFEQGQGWSGGGSNATSATSGYGQGGGYPQSTNQTGYTPSYPAQGMSPREGQRQPSPPRTTSSSGVSGPKGYTSVPPISSSGTRTSQQASYYDPNSPGYDFGEDDVEDPFNPPPASNEHATTALSSELAPAPIASDPSSPPLPTMAARSVSPPLAGSSAYIPGGLRSNSNTPPPTAPTGTGTSTSSPVDLSQRSFTGVQGGTTSRPPSTGPASSVDFSKLGLLPKRPISLVRPQSPLSSTPPPSGSSQATRGHTTSSDDELDYVENPFEERG